jgi:hypothetical protein
VIYFIVEFLGVTISDDGSWNKHIELLIDKAYSIQIYPISEGYLRKKPVERRGKYSEPL